MSGGEGAMEGAARFRVPVAEDDPDFRMLLVRTLELLDAETLEASDGLVAVPVRTLRSPEAVFLDGNAPGLDGWSRAARMRKAERALNCPDCVLVPISRDLTRACRCLTERYNGSFAGILPAAAAARGLSDGDRATIRSEIGEIGVCVTEGVYPGAAAISHHCGHWGQGESGSGRRTPVNRTEADGPLRWWSEHGAHVNYLMTTRGDPIGGSMCWNDTPVRVPKAEEA